MAASPPRCPVPPEQLPINQYQDMRDSWFYRWASQTPWAYTKPLIILWCLSWAISGPMAAASFAPAKHPWDFGLWAAAGALVLPLLALVQLYTGWIHVGQRLRQEAVPYEESGWYDGQIWTKPEDILNRDRLLVEYQVQPVLRRMQKTFAILILLMGGLVAATYWF